MTQLQNNIDILSILEEMEELYNVLMFYWTMNLNFWHQLLLSSAFSEWSLNNYLRSGNL